MVTSLGGRPGAGSRRGDDEAFIGGGGEIFALALPLADRIYLTAVDTGRGLRCFLPGPELGRLARDGTPGDPRRDEHNQYASIYRVLEQRRRQRINASFFFYRNINDCIGTAKSK